MEKLLDETKSGVVTDEFVKVESNVRHPITVGGEGWAIVLCVLLLIAISACNKLIETPGGDTGPPIGFTDKQWLGKQLFFDTNLSEPAGQACAACHASQVGWTGPDAVTDMGGAVYEGAVNGRFGNRKPPSSAYGGDSPIFHLDATNGWTGGACSGTAAPPA